MSETNTLLHPLLQNPDDWAEGYRRLFAKEIEAMQFSAHQHAELVERWQRLLTLHRQGIAGHGTLSPNLSEDEDIAFKLRLQLLGLTAGTSKLSLDAALFGYYSASLGLTRHLIDSWIHAAHVGIWPEYARLWFRKRPEDQGRALPKRRNDVEALNALKEHFLEHYPDDVILIERAKDIRRGTNKGVHVSGWLLDQAASGEDNRFKYGPNYRAQLALVTLSCGVWATILATLEIHRLIPQNLEWQAAMAQIRAEHTVVIPDFADEP